jgi:hypothetical protein
MTGWGQLQKPGKRSFTESVEAIMAAVVKTDSQLCAQSVIGGTNEYLRGRRDGLRVAHNILTNTTKHEGC